MKSVDITFVYGRLDRIRDGKKQIEIRVYFPDTRQRVYKSTGIWVSHFVDGKIPAKEKNHVNLNRQLEQQKKEIRDLYDDFLLRQKPFTPDDLRSYFHGNDVRVTFNQFFREQLSKQDIRHSTYQNKISTLNLLNEFSQIQMSELTYKLITDFNVFLRDKGLKQTTIFKVNSHVKNMINIAQNMDLIDKNPYRNITVKKGTTKKFALTTDQIEAIYSLPESELRDVFLISCCTGLRLSDVTRLNGSVVEVDGSMYVKIDEMTKIEGRGVMVKGDLIFPWGDELLRKHKKTPITISYKTILKDIHRLGNEIGVGGMTFHISRHTFLTHVAIKTGSIFSVMKYGGISSVQTAQSYVDMANGAI